MPNQPDTWPIVRRGEETAKVDEKPKGESGKESDLITPALAGLKPRVKSVKFTH